MPPLTTLDVQGKKFTRAMRGYAIDEVDAFLDEVAEELDRLSKMGASPENPADEEAIARALVQAQRVAEQTLADARAEAEAILVDAESTAQQITESAQRRAQEIIEEAENHARQVKDQLVHEQNELENAIQALQKFESEYRERLRGCVEDLMNTLDSSVPSGSVAPVPPPGLMTTSS